MSPVEHVLTRACRQLREEFLDAWTNHAVNNASNVGCAIRNFEVGDTGKIRETMAALPPLNDGSQRTFIMRFILTNDFERSARQKHRQRRQLSEGTAQFEFFTDVVFNYKTLDADCIESYGRGSLYHRTCWMLSWRQRNDTRPWLLSRDKLESNGISTA